MNWSPIAEMPVRLHRQKVLLQFDYDWKEGRWEPGMFPLGAGPTHYLEVESPGLPTMSEHEIQMLFVNG